MAKYKLSINETRCFNHGITIETDLNEEEVDSLLDEVERSKPKPDRLDDYIDLLVGAGQSKDIEIKISERSIDEDGYNSEIECDELEEIEDCEEE